MTARAVVTRLLTPLAGRIAGVHGVNDLRQDPALLAHFLRLLDRVTWVFSPDVRHVENLPATGPVLVVGNHSCVIYMPDAAVLAAAVAARRGAGSPTYGLAYDLLFTLPGFSDLLRRLGLLPASDQAARRALAEGAAVLVFPGGDHDACRPWSERDRIAFGGHAGFVRLALSTGVPVVPAVAHGAHHGMVILARGEPLARALGLSEVRVNVLPLLLGPLGPIPVLPPPPLPTHITIEFLPPMRWGGIEPAAARDPEVVSTCYDEISGLMQSTLDRLAAENPHPVTGNVRELAAKVTGRV